MPSTVAVIREGDYDGLRGVFRDVFGSDISEAFLHWKYGNGRGRCYGVFSDSGVLLAHCGLTFRHVLAEGRLWRIPQLGDLMVAGGGRSSLARGTSVFHQLLSHVLERVGDDQNPEDLIFGFPSDRAMRLAEKLDLVTSVGVMHEVVFAPEAKPRSWWRLHPINASERFFQRDANRLWERMADDFGNAVVGTRDADYLRHRYADHPEHRYAFFTVVPRLGGAIGLAVCRQHGDEWELMDLVASHNKMPQVLSTLQGQLSAFGIKCMKLWVPERHVEHLRSAESSVAPLQFRIVANRAGSQGNPARYDGRWWLTSGDADYR